jgi:hypothetical protein
MRILFLLGVLVVWPMTTHAADFPDPKDLPSQKNLPDPLVNLKGQKPKDADEWFQKHRPELRALFAHYMYGELPPAPKSVTAKVLHEDPKALGGKAVLREIALDVGFKDHPIYLLVITPAQAKGPVPTFVGAAFCGNHAIVDDPKVRLSDVWQYPGRKGVKDNKASEENRGTEKATWNPDLIVERGYGLAVFYNGDIDPDRNDVRGGIRPFLDPKLQTATIACWAWGIHRAVDYLVTDKAIDAKKIIVVGHSRLGKTALLAAATDDRIAAAIPHQAGCGGTAPSRGTVGESVKQINDRFPHWFNQNFKQFNNDPTKLPFDQNGLVALCAPRPVLFSNAVEDTWANPNGQFEVLRGANSVYEFLKVEGIKAEKPPELGQLINTRLGYFLRAGKHSMNREDWQAFLDWADKQVK